MSSIYNFQEVSGVLACSGQPREGQLALIAANGYKVVINLGLLDTKYALKDEASSVKNLGLTYYHIPVLFDSPQMDSLKAFIETMNEHAGEKTLVHCAANYRASAFMGLYLFSKTEMTEEEMTDFIENIWRPDHVWEDFIEDGVAYIKQSLGKAES
jgi:protein tyrosine phosphatase (PTP) superfamily phosphohydrolase (DUF442 family)